MMLTTLVPVMVNRRPMRMYTRETVDCHSLNLDSQIYGRPSQPVASSRSLISGTFTEWKVSRPHLQRVSDPNYKLLTQNDDWLLEIKLTHH